MTDKQQDTREKLTEIAEHMSGWTWQASEHDSVTWFSYFAHTSGARLQINHREQFKGRAEISIAWPNGPNGGYRSMRDWGLCGYDDTPPRISISLSRDAKVLARDIMRRIATQESIALHAQAMEERAAEIEQMSNATDYSERVKQWLSERNVKSFDLPGSTYFTITVAEHNPSASIDINGAPPELTKRIIEAIGEWRDSVGIDTAE